jgi:hypothetical protein
MDNNYNWLVDVFLGTSDKIAPPAANVPDVPLLDAIAEGSYLAKRELSLAYGADATIAEIDRAELISTLCPIPVEAQIEADVRKFSPTLKATPGLEKIMVEALPTSKVLESWTPTAQAMIADLIKSAYPSRQSEHKVCKLRYTLHDGVVSCCPLDLGNNLYKDQKTGRVFDFIKEGAAIEHCKNHCEVSA